MSGCIRIINYLDFSGFPLASLVLAVIDKSQRRGLLNASLLQLEHTDSIH